MTSTRAASGWSTSNGSTGSPGAAFITPPGRRHSHHNESDTDARLIPIRDAGPHTYLRTLDLRFMTREQAAEALKTSWDISPENSSAEPVGTA